MRQLLLVLVGIIIALLCCSCGQKAATVRTEQISEISFADVRLGDGVPLNITIAVYWQGENAEVGPARPDTVLARLLYARGMETIRDLTNQFAPVDSVFSTRRDDFIATVKEELLLRLPEPDLTVRDVIVLDVRFPAAFTQALEDIGLQDLREEQIKKQNQLALAQAAANEKKAVAEGQVAIALAEAEGRLQAIQARTEGDRMKSEMAKAETAAAVARTQAAAEADRLRQLKVVEVEKQREIEMIAVEKQRAMDKVGFEKELDLARLCQENPTYASFLVNRELAANVEIAVLPTGTDMNVFGGLLQSRLPGKTNNE